MIQPKLNRLLQTQKAPAWWRLRRGSRRLRPCIRRREAGDEDRYKHSPDYGHDGSSCLKRLVPGSILSATRPWEVAAGVRPIGARISVATVWPRANGTEMRGLDFDPGAGVFRRPRHPHRPEVRR